ncbi:hypothetical protein BJ912DRAFT_222119 [Pholiota molesta]|nr:hypothetical protein BJ912DRAFT_222119 [Pholiota molesta]
MCIRGSHITSPCGRLTLLYRGSTDNAVSPIKMQRKASCRLANLRAACRACGPPRTVRARKQGRWDGGSDRERGLALDGRWVEGRMGVGGGEQQARQRGPNKLCGRSLKPLYRCCLSNPALCSLLSVCLCNRNPRWPLFPSQRLPPRPPSAVAPALRFNYILLHPSHTTPRLIFGWHPLDIHNFTCWCRKNEDFLIAMSGVLRRKSDPSFLFQAA